MDIASAHHMILAFEQSPSRIRVSLEVHKNERQIYMRYEDDTNGKKLNHGFSLKLLTFNVNINNNHQC